MPPDSGVTPPPAAGAPRAVPSSRRRLPHQPRTSPPGSPPEQQARQARPETGLREARPQTGAREAGPRQGAEVRQSPLPATGSSAGPGTPLYDALLSQIQARESLAHSAATGDEIPAADLPVDAPGPRPAGAQIRIVRVLTRVGSLVRATALRIVIIVVAGTAGTVTGINLMAPDVPRTPARSLQPSVAQPAAGAAAPGSVPASEQANALATVEATVAAQGASSAPPAVTAGGIEAPSAVTLDEFGRGRLTLASTSKKAVTWRLSAPGLAVEPSSGTLKPGQTLVLSVRALRVRYWCGAPAPASAPLELRGTKGSATTTVRWRTC